MTNRGACRPLGEFFWRTDEASQRAGRYHGGRTQIYVGVAIAHSAFKVSVGRADRGLTFLHQTATQTDAGSAARRQRNGAGVYQSLPVTIRFGPRLNF